MIARLPMVYGANSPRVNEIKRQLKENEAIEVFSNVVVNATSEAKLTQQLHYIINETGREFFTWAAMTLFTTMTWLQKFVKTLGEKKPLLKNVYDSNFDRFLAVFPKDNLLPKNLQISIQEVVASTLVS